MNAFIDILIGIAGLGGLGVLVWYARRTSGGDQDRRPFGEAARAGLSRSRPVADRFAAWCGRKWYEWRARADRDIIQGAPAPGAARRTAPGRTVQAAARKVAAPPPYQAPGASPEADIASIAEMPVPEVWKPVIEAVRSFEPGDYAEHLAYFSGNAAGLLGLAEAMHDQADTQLTTIGLDPGAVRASVDMADSVGDCAHDVVLAKHAFLVLYEEILRAIENGLKLPNRAREFFSRDAA